MDLEFQPGILPKKQLFSVKVGQGDNDEYAINQYQQRYERHKRIYRTQMSDHLDQDPFPDFRY
jgi:hypothetical protein